ncbi:MAG: flagellar motor switch protein FliN [Alkalispirochaeta sp.]
MSDGSLSQDEIDALLAGTGDIDLGDSSGGGGASAPAGSLEGLKAALTETVGQQQSNMAMITGREVEVAPPTVNGGTPAGLSGEMVQITYNLGDGGSHSYLLSAADAMKFASASMGLDDVELDPAALNAIQEVFSHVAGPVINVLSERTGITIMPEPATAATVGISDVTYPSDPVYARYTVTLGDETATLYEVFQNSFASQLAGGAPQASGGGQPNGGGLSSMMGGMGGQPSGMQGSYGGQMPNMGQNMGAGMGNMMGGMPGFGGGANVQSVQFPSLQQQGGSSEQGNIGLLMDVYMEMTVELGRTKKLIREILGMGEGTIIELDKLAGEPVDILVNHKLIAKGEVVVIDENFGVRVTEIVSPMERVSDMT